MVALVRTKPMELSRATTNCKNCQEMMPLHNCVQKLSANTVSIDNSKLNPARYAFSPRVHETKCEYYNKEKDLNKAEKAQGLENNCPGRNEYDIYIKCNKKEGKYVETQWVLYSRC